MAADRPVDPYKAALLVVGMATRAYRADVARSGGLVARRHMLDPR